MAEECCLIEICYLGYSSGTIRSLHEINKTSNIVVDTSVGKASSITVEEVVKTRNYIWPNYVLCINIKCKHNTRGSETSVW